MRRGLCVRTSLGALLTVIAAAGMIAIWCQPLRAEEPRAPSQIEPGTCLNAECHAALKEKKIIHGPLEDDACEICHDQADEKVHEFTFIDTTSELCYGCHEDVTVGKKFIHQPMKEERLPCLPCHDPHSSDTEKLVKAETETDLCLECHADRKAGDAYHVSEIQTCVDCHDPHASDIEQRLKAKSPDLCFGCHADLKETLDQSALVHGPVASGCLLCHDPHRTLTGKGLVREGETLCMTCHEHFAETFSAMSSRHSKILEENDCRRCHEPHAGGDFLLKGSSVDLCLSCHSRNIEASDGRTIKSLESIKAEGAKLHGPLAQGQCIPCHEPHGNMAAGFLSQPYPEEFYSPYDRDEYELCFSCHKSDLAEAEHTTEGTGFRHGKRNLHFVHVNKTKKGRTCRACHAPHSSANPHLVVDSVMFGNWPLPIGFEKSENGGTCASGCHAVKTYSREAEGE